MVGCGMARLTSFLGVGVHDSTAHNHLSHRFWSPSYFTVLCIPTNPIYRISSRNIIYYITLYTIPKYLLLPLVQYRTIHTHRPASWKRHGLHRSDRGLTTDCRLGPRVIQRSAVNWGLAQCTR
ncbi:hypothetical protein GMDG_03089 [Pseudogymnoascus destructans 20631-21]|uniref:Uncharacterized protein n=1 Tax=Pseudogymnoascus destructans (strain ATCC MYA-4855 / 20631-21) TaxID=658429 RepID=L8G8E4_PSED2|nr:hypothetical protein GMDG_03089 [Pseudogymnoascus destructans 20631-21]